MKKSLYIALLSIFFLVPTVAMGATSVSQYGITWTFDKDYQVGQFVTGDYYVIDSGQGVGIRSVTPFPSGGRNGSMINPSSNVQAYDSDANMGYGDYSSSLAVSFPVILKANQSLVSTEGITTQNKEWNGASFTASNHHINTAAVLTCLSSAPPAGAFRPPYVGSQKPLYNISQINTSMLPRLSAANMPATVDGNLSGVSMLERGLQRPWILHGNDWIGRQIHPAQNMHNYHEQISEFWGKALTFLMTDQYTTTFLYRYLQTAIDAYYTITLTSSTDSSHFGAPIVIAGLLLGDKNMQNVFIENRQNITPRGHEKFYYAGDRPLSQTSSIVPQRQSWTGWTNSAGKAVFFAKQAGEEYEHLHPSEWTCYGPHCKAEVYRAQHDVYGLVGQILPLRILSANGFDADRLYDKDAALDYIDRWMEEGFRTEESKNTGRTYYEEFQHYKPTTIYNLNYQSGGSSFIDAMWGMYRNNPGSNPAEPSPPITTNPPAAPLNFQLAETQASSSQSQVDLWWTATVTRSANVLVDIFDGSTLLQTVTVNQTVNGGNWNTLGSYTFTKQGKIVIHADGPDSTCADAIRVVTSSDNSVRVVDNGEPGTSYTGTWGVSSGLVPYGSESLYSRNGATYTFEFQN
jgi:hypothetical protein